MGRLGAGREQLRRLLLDRRDATSPDMLQIAGERIRRVLRGMPGFAGSARVGAYWSTGSEVPTRGIIQDIMSGGREVLLPRVEGDLIRFRRVTGMQDLEEGAFGIMEPRASCGAAEPDLVLVPAVGLAPDGSRLGYGRGYYDRYLAGSGAVSVALALEKQVISRIPAEPHDVGVSWIVTEEGARRARTL
ncbi:MAG: 5-formyltetrahydrofolate cyclo-ligase [Nitrosopumilus sp.]|nr:5-formyltetrahydrofolate cyclo-ligase [Nitrosopumilus sp.]